ncbi:MAG: GIY-YIG nuclease family protein [Clostridia bacterium]|nr:GIY-YIG nuclease family protein [Clostridia bacterium]
MKVSNERKKELQEQYRLTKPDMGIFAIIRRSSPKYYLEATQDLKSAMNGAEFKLNAGMHPRRELQEDWKEAGKDGFEIKVLEQAEYDKDESKVDYEDDLALLKLMWVEKLTGEAVELY